MKNIILVALVAISALLSFCSSESAVPTVTATFHVSGNCGMCKKTIEKAALTLAKTASWDKKTDILTVSYDDKKVKLLQIYMKIAAAGYDTDKVKATETAYQSLPMCCQYRDGDGDM